eukprot:PhM_4_TR2955/c0_g1_i1/m.7678
MKNELKFHRHNVRHLILIDLDNVKNFFEVCDNAGQTVSVIPEGTFVWCFCSRNTQLSRTLGKSLTFYSLLVKQMIEIDFTPATRADSAGVALAMRIGQLHHELPQDVPFTILSEADAFKEVQPRLQGRDVHHVRADATMKLRETLARRVFSSSVVAAQPAHPAAPVAAHEMPSTYKKSQNPSTSSSSRSTFESNHSVQHHRRVGEHEYRQASGSYNNNNTTRSPPQSRSPDRAAKKTKFVEF